MTAGESGDATSNEADLRSTASSSRWSSSSSSVVDGSSLKRSSPSSALRSSVDDDGAAGNAGWLKSWIPFGSKSPDSVESRIRQRTELFLARHFLDTVMTHGREIVREKREQVRLEREVAASTNPYSAGGISLSPAMSQASPVVVNDLTEDEHRIFKRASYYGWKEGMAAGLTTFGVLFGGLRWAAARRGGGGGLVRSSAQLAMTPTSPRPGYQQLDGISAKRSAFARAAAAPVVDRPAPHLTPSAPLLGASTDVMTQLHFMCVGALSLVVGNLVAQTFTDHERLFRQVERVPLLPGRSVLCHRMCPDLIEQHQNLLRHNSWERLIYGPVEAATDNAEGSSERFKTEKRPVPPVPPPESYVPDYTPADLLNDPVTPELESVVHLLQNCRARIRYVSELRDHRNERHNVGGEREDETESIVTVPAPGVPASVIAIDSETMGS